MQILFIGGGNMASALIGGLLEKGQSANNIRVIELDSNKCQELHTQFGVQTAQQLDASSVVSDVIVLAVKPQSLRQLALQLAPLLTQQLVISIAAGIRLADLSRWLGDYPTLIRVMPNTPALVQQGVSGLFAQAGVSNAHQQQASTILSAVGRILWLSHEEEIDAITAASGSGPAYVFYFLEAMQAGAEQQGFSPETARMLALETFRGAVTLATQSSDSLATLRQKVTSKGGTTEQAILSFEEGKIKEWINMGMQACANRSRELGELLGKDSN